MSTEKTDGLLKRWLGVGIERPRPELADEVKARIPNRLYAHGLDTISIVVDLRISKVAAAAAIVVAVIVLGAVFAGRGTTAERFFGDGRMLIKYCLGGEQAYRMDTAVGLAGLYQDLLKQGKEVVYYGDKHIDAENRYAIVMHWKLPNGRYGVILGDLTPRTVSAQTLVRLQSLMLEESGRQ